MNGNFNLLKEIIENQNIKDNNFDVSISLLIAAMSNHYEIVDWLIDNGMNLTHKETNETLLFVACRENKIDLLKHLLEKSIIDIHIPNNEGYYPLHIASSKGNIEIVKILVNYGAEVNKTNKSDLTALRMVTEILYILYYE